MARTVSIGTESFYKLREDNAFLVDKTEFIKEWWNGRAAVTLITRPRRFGKTLTMSMVECFFSTRFAGRADLFEGLKIWEDEELRKLQGTVPVVNMSLKNAKADNYGAMKVKLGIEISYLYEQYQYLKQSDKLTEEDKAYITQMIRYRNEMPDYEIETAIKALSKYLYQHYGVKPIILIDEYDAPLQAAYLKGFFDEAIGLIRGIFASALKTNDYLDRAILTGVTRISKESLFSDLNNLAAAGMLDNAYADKLGFTSEEVADALAEFGLSGEKDEVKKWYDGYTIGDRTDIYNPWAIINYLATKGKFDLYWSLTSGNDLIKQLLMDGNKSMKTKFEELLQGRAIDVSVSKNVVFQELDMKDNEAAVWTLMLATGYLKVTQNGGIQSGQVNCSVKVTNYEICGALKHVVKYWFAERSDNYNSFIKALLSNDLESLNAYLAQVLKNCMSYHDGGKNSGVEKIKDREDRKTPENFYHGLVLGMLVDLQDRYYLTSNRESGYGRYDIMLEPLPAEVQTVIRESERRNRDDMPAYIIEFKVQNETSEKSLEETADNALKQIEEKAYEAALLAKGIAKDKIYKYGMAFNGKDALVKPAE